MLIVGSLQRAALLLLLRPGEEDAWQLGSKSHQRQRRHDHPSCHRCHRRSLPPSLPGSLPKPFDNQEDNKETPSPPATIVAVPPPPHLFPTPLPSWLDGDDATSTLLPSPLTTMQPPLLQLIVVSFYLPPPPVFGPHGSTTATLTMPLYLLPSARPTSMQGRGARWQRCPTPLSHRLLFVPGRLRRTTKASCCHGPRRYLRSHRWWRFHQSWRRRRHLSITWPPTTPKTSHCIPAFPQTTWPAAPCSCCIIMHWRRWGRATMAAAAAREVSSFFSSWNEFWNRRGAREAGWRL